ncbi:MAG: AbgT family transporter [Christensenellales bacterium]|nr:AbgT family transporter [Christensenellales bacterium]
MKRKSNAPKPRLMDRLLNVIEVAGNKLPNPALLFAYLSLFIIVLSAILKFFNLSATGSQVSSTGVSETTVSVVSLLTRDGLIFMLTKAISNFTSYAPLGVVLVSMLGVGVAERSGLISTLMKKAVKVTPDRLLTPMLVFLGVMSNIASDAGYVILLPLGAMMFRACGRHPIAGLAAAFAGVSGAFSANMLIASTDSMLASISQSSAAIIDPSYEVSMMGNYFFLFVSAILLTIVGTIITDKIIEPRLGKYENSDDVEENLDLTQISEVENKGLKKAGIASLIYVLLLVIGCLVPNSFLLNENGSLFGKPTSPFLEGIVLLIALLFFIAGVVYGKCTGAFKSSTDIVNALTKAMSGMGSFLVLAFIIAQFINYFNYTNLGTILALAGTNFLQSANIGLIPLMVLFVLFTAFMNLFMTSASAKWNILSPVFVPMFMQLGYTPELCQLAYRIGDSCTNIITPMMVYYAVILLFAQKYDKKMGIGTITATMIPYSFAFLVIWTLLLVVWLLLGLPIGPGTGLFYAPV